MEHQKTILTLILFSLLLCGVVVGGSKTDLRKDLISFLRKAGLDEELDAAVSVSMDNSGNVRILDEGTFFMQYMVMEPQKSADADIVIDPNVTIPASCNKLVIVTHGWIDKFDGDWSADTARQIAKKVDPNEWVCGSFDWHRGALVVNPVDAAKYGRDVAGPRLANAVLKLPMELEHLHMVGHSAGSWTINTAAKILAKKTKAQIHLTFLDAYVPPGWEEKELGKIASNENVWAEHYYTRDLTLKATQTNLSAAHNVDITSIDTWFKEHEFPYRWYYATVAGKYRNVDSERDEKVITRYKQIDYGFTRSREAGNENWKQSLKLKKGNSAVELKKPKSKSWFDSPASKKQR